ncbi:family 43 glycosylhydrolase [Arthrobacter sp. R4]|uniref:family 43 glycosylhydrolase n=1 Tax=Arthrobacter sp. R4 TaxID=644417 RepID=UPI003EDAE123
MGSSALDLSTGRFVAPDYEIWQGSGLPAAEGPHLYQIGDYWHLSLAEGGTKRGHCITWARSTSPRGPFEAHPANPIFSRRSTMHPVQIVGHADLVQTPEDDWAAVYLGVRPRGSTPGYHVLGRETFLAGIEWKDGWPVFVDDRFDVPVVCNDDIADDFAAPNLDMRWVVPGGEPAAVVQRSEGGGITVLPPSPISAGMLCTRVRNLQWKAEAVIVDSGRFLLRVDDRHWYGLSLDAGRVLAQATIGGVEQVLAEVHAQGPVTLRIEAVPPSTLAVPVGDAGPDVLISHPDAT